MRSGFVALLGRPNVGKSTLVNQLVGEKVTITAATPNTTRHAVRGVVHRDDAQIVLVDTPGLHRPRTALGRRLNETALGALGDVDAVLAIIEAPANIGPGDRNVLTQLLGSCASDGPAPFCVVNKLDVASKAKTAERLMEAEATVRELAAQKGLDPEVVERVEYFAVSARTGRGVGPLADALAALMPEGPKWFEDDVKGDLDDEQFVAELVREQLLRRVREELPHAIHCRVAEWEWPVIRVEILVERDSQKAIVIGKGGEVLKSVGIAVREQLPEGAFLELKVLVEPRWQTRPDILERWGY